MKSDVGWVDKYYSERGEWELESIRRAGDLLIFIVIPVSEFIIMY